MGVNLKDVDWVIIFGPPPSALDLVQMVGRCSRRGQSGRATILLSKNSKQAKARKEKDELNEEEGIIQTHSDPKEEEILKELLYGSKLCKRETLMKCVSFPRESENPTQQYNY